MISWEVCAAITTPVGVYGAVVTALLINVVSKIETAMHLQEEALRTAASPKPVRATEPPHINPLCRAATSQAHVALQPLQEEPHLDRGSDRYSLLDKLGAEAATRRRRSRGTALFASDDIRAVEAFSADSRPVRLDR